MNTENVRLENGKLPIPRVSVSDSQIEELFPFEDENNATPTKPAERIAAYNSRQSDRREGARRLLESDSLQPVSKAVCERSVSVDIVDSDIATIEALHDLLLDAHGYSLDFITLKRARELTAKMYKAFK